MSSIEEHKNGKEDGWKEVVVQQQDLWAVVPELPKVIDFKASEIFRHRSEVRWLLKERIRLGQDNGKSWLRRFLASPAVKGRRMMLERDIKEQWSLGNKGNVGEWFLT
jgi:hypothetical protein